MFYTYHTGLPVSYSSCLSQCLSKTSHPYWGGFFL